MDASFPEGQPSAGTKPKQPVFDHSHFHVTVGHRPFWIFAHLAQILMVCP